jgi:hypothetical protein
MEEGELVSMETGTPQGVVASPLPTPGGLGGIWKFPRTLTYTGRNEGRISAHSVAKTALAYVLVRLIVGSPLDESRRFPGVCVHKEAPLGECNDLILRFQVISRTSNAFRFGYERRMVCSLT